MENTYIYKQQKKLRCGYTTGTCAAAASMAAAVLLLGDTQVREAAVKLPRGTDLSLAIQDWERGDGWASCAVIKDAGDDPDATDGIKICARVSKALPDPCGDGGWYEHKNGDVYLLLTGGVGIGVVKKPGLSCEVGKCAINPVPRQMIFEHVERVCREFHYSGSLWIVISAPEGEARAENTFNSRLGIEGGISILGTTGIVEPMSEEALLATIRLDIRRQAVDGREVLLLTPGNYGEAFLRESLGIDLGRAVKCSNYIGQALDMAEEEGMRTILLVGHAGKLVKVAAGIMNTHSLMADGRMEVLAAHSAVCGADADLAERILDAVTVDQALSAMEEVPGLRGAVMERIVGRMHAHLKRRAGAGAAVEAVTFTNERGILGCTEGAERLIEMIKAGG